MKENITRLTTDLTSEPESAEELTAHEIVILKRDLDRTIHSGRAPHLIRHIVFTMMTQAEALGASDCEHRNQEHLFSDTAANDLARRVGLLSASWGMHLQNAVSLPGSDWPEGMAPPGTFAYALRELNALDAPS